MIAAILYGVAAAGLVVFLAIYCRRTDWYARPEGWHLLATILVLILNCGLAISVILFGEYPGVQVVRFVAALLIAVVAVGLPISLLSIQRRGRRRHTAGAELP
jgi:hypothetical protein